MFNKHHVILLGHHLNKFSGLIGSIKLGGLVGSSWSSLSKLGGLIGSSLQEAWWFNRLCQAWWSNRFFLVITSTSLVV